VNEFKQMVLQWQQRKEGMDIRVKPLKAADLPPWVTNGEPGSPLVKSEEQQEQEGEQAAASARLESPETARKRKRDEDEETAAAVAEAEAEDMAAQQTDDEKGLNGGVEKTARAAAIGNGTLGNTNGMANRSGSNKAELPLLQEGPPLPKQSRLQGGQMAGKAVGGGMPAVASGVMAKQEGTQAKAQGGASNHEVRLGANGCDLKTVRRILGCQVLSKHMLGIVVLRLRIVCLDIQIDRVIVVCSCEVMHTWSCASLISDRDSCWLHV
jgi:hypothetical protein